MIGFDPLSFSPFAKGEMNKGCEKLRVSIVAEGLRS
jgi:hypothetical protein